MKIRNIFILSITVFLLTIVLNDVVYYYTVERSLTKSMESRTLAISNQIKLSIDHTEYAFSITDELMAQKLRDISIGSLKELPKDYRKVNNDTLIQLKNKYDISDITLFAKLGDDIVGVKSSNPKQIGISSKDWGDYFIAFNELFALKPVTIKGDVLPNFWAGQLSGSSSDPSSVKNKYGYYYDGSTNYIINPYMDNQYIKKVEDNAGVEKIIRNTVSENKDLLEITVFNPNTIALSPNDPSLFTYSNGRKNPRYGKRQVFYGDYKYKTNDDIKHILEASKNGKSVHVSATIQKNKVLKTFFPVTLNNVEFPYVIGITTSLDSITSALNQQMVNFISIIVLVSILSIIVATVLFRLIRKAKDDIAEDVQNNYTSEINNLIVAFRGQHHDYSNHLDTIKSFIELKMYDELDNYLDDLAEEFMLVNDMIEIGHPALASLLNAKVTHAAHRKIKFSYDFDAVKRIDITGLRSVDIVKILGNLIDNAFEEAIKVDPANRRVHIEAKIVDGLLSFSITNTLSERLSTEDLNNILNYGYSKKFNEGHSGLGLAIVNERLSNYKGKIEISQNQCEITFKVVLPLSA
ncbi:sensor histidine kinase [Paenibacillus gansuensis]|uniref:Sensor histidine kinase n=1 Tax=Paenibacillus gansuensis TaxID=306542 RepID=A0ABW5PH14_9BACL